MPKKQLFWQTKFERSVWWLRFGPSLFALGLLALLQWRRIPMSLAFFGFVAICAGSVIYFFAAKIHTFCHLKRNRYLLCKNCGYPLAGLKREGQCPECAAHYHRGETRHFWCSRYKFIWVLFSKRKGNAHE